MIRKEARSSKAYLAGRFKAALGAPFPGNVVLEQLHGIGAKSARNGRKLDDVEAALAVFILCDKRLRAAEFSWPRPAGGHRSFPHCDKQIDQPGIIRGFESLLHLPPRP